MGSLREKHNLLKKDQLTELQELQEKFKKLEKNRDQMHDALVHAFEYIGFIASFNVKMKKCDYEAVENRSSTLLKEIKDIFS